MHAARRKSQPFIEGVWLLDDTDVRRAAVACLRGGIPAYEVAQVIGVCAHTLCDILGVGKQDRL